MELIAKIQQAEHDRARLEAILATLDANSTANANDLAALAQALLSHGAYAQVLELKALAQVIDEANLELCACAGTAAANIGLTEHAISSLRDAAAWLDSNPDVDNQIAEQVFATLGRLHKQRALELPVQLPAELPTQLPVELPVKLDGELNHDPNQKPAKANLRVAEFNLAMQAYAKAYQRSQGLWSGINLATLCLLSDQPEQAKRLAQLLLQAIHAGQYPVQSELDQQWQYAVSAEASLLLGKRADAGANYQRAVALALQHKRYAHVASMRRQAELILKRNDQRSHAGSQFDTENNDLLELWFAKPRFVVFTGHRLDAINHESDAAANDPAARFPATAIAANQHAIENWLLQQNVALACCALSEGADVLFAQAAIKLGIELHIFLASNREQIQLDWQNLGLGDYHQVIPALLSQASSVVELLPEGPTGSTVDYRYANEVLLGSTLLRAREVHADLLGLALWDRLPGRGEGSTASMVQQMQLAGLTVHVIDPVLQSARILSAGAVDTALPTQDSYQIKALLFGDFVGFSRLNNLQMQEFVGLVLPAVADLLHAFEAAGVAIPVKNTWGDGLYLVFDRADAAADFALKLQAKLASLANQVSFNLKLRIALHYSPVRMTFDPIAQRPNAIGPGVSKAARLEPATAPGAVYASAAIAAELALQGAFTSLRCRYLANLPWAKGFGSFPTYIVEAGV